MSATNKDDCSSDPTCCSAADGPQLTINADRSADDGIIAALRARISQAKEDAARLDYEYNVNGHYYASDVEEGKSAAFEMLLTWLDELSGCDE